MPVHQVGSLNLHYEEMGQGPPLVFLSGLGGDHRAFSVPMRHFASRFRTLAIDNRDVGQSDRARGPYSTADMADDVAGWLRGISVEGAHIVGHSLGGLIAQELALGHPDLVKSLVLASSHAGADPWRIAVLQSWIMMRRLAPGPGEFTRLTLPWLAAPAFYHQEAQVEGLVLFSERNKTPQDFSAFERQAHAAISHDTRDRLDRIKVPTLVMVGELDLVNPPRVAYELVELIEGAKIEVLPQVGHLPHVEDNRTFRDVILSFLQTIEPLAAS